MCQFVLSYSINTPWTPLKSCAKCLNDMKTYALLWGLKRLGNDRVSHTTTPCVSCTECLESENNVSRKEWRNFRSAIKLTQGEGLVTNHKLTGCTSALTHQAAQQVRRSAVCLFHLSFGCFCSSLYGVKAAGDCKMWLMFFLHLKRNRGDWDFWRRLDRL